MLANEVLWTDHHLMMILAWAACLVVQGALVWSKCGITSSLYGRVICSILELTNVIVICSAWKILLWLAVVSWATMSYMSSTRLTRFFVNMSKTLTRLVGTNLRWGTWLSNIDSRVSALLNFRRLSLSIMYLLHLLLYLCLSWGFIHSLAYQNVHQQHLLLLVWNSSFWRHFLLLSINRHSWGCNCCSRSLCSVSFTCASYILDLFWPSFSVSCVHVRIWFWKLLM